MGCQADVLSNAAGSQNPGRDDVADQNRTKHNTHNNYCRKAASLNTKFRVKATKANGAFVRSFTGTSSPNGNNPTWQCSLPASWDAFIYHDLTLYVKSGGMYLEDESVTVYTQPL